MELKWKKGDIVISQATKKAYIITSARGRKIIYKRLGTNKSYKATKDVWEIMLKHKTFKRAE